MKRIISLVVACVMIFSLAASCLIVENINAKSFKRYEFYGRNTDYVKVKGKKIIVKGKAVLTHKLDSGTDSRLKTLKKKKRTYKITSKTKYYSLHWSSATRISKKTALSRIKHLGYYGGFQVKVKGKKVYKLYILNHGA